jgi:hypothetical protein
MTPEIKKTLKLAQSAFKEIASETYDPWTNGAKAQRIAEAALPIIEQALAAQPAPAAPVQDAEGENRAVRSFLLLYGQRGVTVGGMKRHMGMSGFKSWPAWVDTEPEGAHLTKAGAQLWIRHLFALEATPPAQPVVPDAITDNSESPDFRAGWNHCRELTIQMRKS